jgi:hypothetical protein
MMPPRIDETWRDDQWVRTGLTWFLFVLNEPRTRWLQLILGEFLLQITSQQCSVGYPEYRAVIDGVGEE